MKTPVGVRNLVSALAWVAISGGALAGPVQNGTFETVFGSEWTAKDAIPSNVGPTPPIPMIQRSAGTRTGGAGQWVLEAAARDHSQDGPVQGSFLSPVLKNALANAGNARTYSTRVWVKLDPSASEASVRCLLRWRDNNVQQLPLILAEAVIRQSGVWVEVTGTATLQWVTSLSAAAIDFEVEQLHKGSSATPPLEWYPTFQIDDLQMELDGDGDGLWDSEESSDHSQTTVSFSDDADSDHDQMTDDWERKHGLNPRDPNDAALDPDHDGFSNLQEYYGATDPNDLNQYPGKPSDALATPQTVEFLRYLALRPSVKEVLVGQMVSDNAVEYASGVAALAAKPNWGRWPAFLGLAVEKQNAPLDVVASIDWAIPYANAGGLVQLKWAVWNPWTLGFMGDLNKIDIPGLLDPAGTSTTSNTNLENQTARATLLSWIDTTANEIKRYNTATGSKPMLFRPMSEMNGNWFWWGHRTRAEYLGLWNFMRDRLMTYHGLHNLVWVYESDSGDHTYAVPTGSCSASDYYYPGDDRVDVMAHNLYNDTWNLSWDANRVYSRYPKIYGVPQAGPGKSLPTSRDGSFNNLTYLNQITARYPRMGFFIAWNSFMAGGGTTLNHLAIIDNANADLLLSDPRALTRDEVFWLAPTVSISAATGVSTSAATVHGLVNPNGLAASVSFEYGTTAQYGTSTAVQSWSAQSIALDASVALSGLTPNTLYHFRVTASNPNGTRMSSDGTFTTAALPAPIAQTLPATALESTAATLNGSVNPGGLATAISFEFGVDSNYGSSTAGQSIGSGTDNVAVSSLLSGLSVDTIYHFRVVATNQSGTSYSSDLTLQTSAAETVNAGTGGMTSLVLASGSGITGEPPTTTALSFGVPSIAADGSLFVLATLEGDSGKESAILSGSPLRVLVRKNSLAPDSNGALSSRYFTNFGDPICDDGGRITFTAKIRDGVVVRSGVYSNVSGTLSEIAVSGGAAPGISGAHFTSINSLVMSATGEIFYVAKVAGGGSSGSNNQGIWVHSASANELLLRKDDALDLHGSLVKVKSFAVFSAVKGSAGQGRSYDDDRLIVRVTTSAGPQALIELRAGASPTIVSVAGDSLASEAQIQSFGIPSLRGGGKCATLVSLVVGAGEVLKTSNQAIVAATANAAMEQVVQKGDAAPQGEGATFANLEDPVFNSSLQLAFVGKLAGSGVAAGNDTGLWWTGAQGLELLAREGSQPAGVPGAKWAKFNALVLPNQSGPLFLATLARGASGSVPPLGINRTNDLGLWAVDQTGVLQLLLRTGDQLQIDQSLKTIRTITALGSVLVTGGQARSYNQARQLVLKITFTDRSQALLQLSVP